MIDTRLVTHAAALLVLGLLTGAAPAAAQGALTAELPEEAPTEVQYRLGPVLVNPNIALPMIGYDTNVFDEAENPKQDWVATLTPDIVFYTELGMLRLAAKSGSEFTYYAHYREERSIAQDLRGRVTARLSRFRPWVGAAKVQSATRPTPEIDLRARREEQEVSAGINFELSPIAEVIAYASRIETRYEDGEIYREVDLVQALNRRAETASVGLRISPTPFTTVRIDAELGRDRFVRATDRDARASRVNVGLTFSPEAIIRGHANIGYEDYQPEQADVPGFRGVRGDVGLTAVGYWRGVLTMSAFRGVQYSFAEAERYYIETGGDLTYTQRIGGPWDLQVRGSRTWLDYGVSQPGGRADGLNSYQAGIGFNFQNDSRFGLNYEYSERQSELQSDRRYTRRRIFGSYSYELWK